MAKQTSTSTDQQALSYIVRVYRCDARRIAGVVEMPIQARRSAFRSFAELKAILLRESKASLPNRRG